MATDTRELETEDLEGPEEEVLRSDKDVKYAFRRFLQGQEAVSEDDIRTFVNEDLGVSYESLRGVANHQNFKKNKDTGLYERQTGSSSRRAATTRREQGPEQQSDPDDVWATQVNEFDAIEKDFSGLPSDPITLEWYRYLISAGVRPRYARGAAHMMSFVDQDDVEAIWEALNECRTLSLSERNTTFNHFRRANGLKLPEKLSTKVGEGKASPTPRFIVNRLNKIVMAPEGTEGMSMEEAMELVEYNRQEDRQEQPQVDEFDRMAKVAELFKQDKISYADMLAEMNAIGQFMGAGQDPNPPGLYDTVNTLITSLVANKFTSVDTDEIKALKERLDLQERENQRLRDEQKEAREEARHKELLESMKALSQPKEDKFEDMIDRADKFLRLAGLSVGDIVQKFTNPPAATGVYPGPDGKPMNMTFDEYMRYEALKTEKDKVNYLVKDVFPTLGQIASDYLQAHQSDYDLMTDQTGEEEPYRVHRQPSQSPQSTTSVPVRINLGNCGCGTPIWVRPGQPNTREIVPCPNCNDNLELFWGEDPPPPEEPKSEASTEAAPEEQPGTDAGEAEEEPKTVMVEAD